MLTSFYEFVRPVLFALQPEDAHAATLKALEYGFFDRPSGRDDPSLVVEFCGMKVPNPIGIAAGFDKDARVPDALLQLGCGFAEVGTITPLPQTGNSRPRIYRLPKDHGVINRLGFNNQGHAEALSRLARRTGGGVVGVNLGANKHATDRLADYVKGIEVFNEVASYFTVNISSPNTPGLRDLQAPDALDELLSRVMAAREALIAAGKRRRPIVIKISPDVAGDDILPIAERLLAHRVDAVAVSNTTLARDGLRDQNAVEAGGLSGRPLFQRATVMLAKIYEATEGRLPLIGIGGIDSGETALSKIEAGATLIQIYTGLVYEGPQLIGQIKTHLAGAVRQAGVQSIAALTGTRAKEWAAKPLV
jgi:dihydroorotate dehydrogenase